MFVLPMLLNAKIRHGMGCDSVTTIPFWGFLMVFHRRKVKAKVGQAPDVFVDGILVSDLMD